MKNILVTGATGHLGSAVIETLLKKIHLCSRRMEYFLKLIDEHDNSCNNVNTVNNDNSGKSDNKSESEDVENTYDTYGTLPDGRQGTENSVENMEY